MAYLEKDGGRIVARVIYDGAPEAGKTTNIRQIEKNVASSRKSELSSPGSTGPRTEYFDWLDFKGGYIHGYSLHCQILGVPGQFSLQGRRKHLLKSADVVVFVADSQPEALRENLRMFQSLNLLRQATAGPPSGLVVQANKQDLPGAMNPLELARHLGVDSTTPVMGARAVEGNGVLQAFVIAMRLAAERIQLLLSSGALGATDGQPVNPEALFAAMKHLEELQDPVETSLRERVQMLAPFHPHGSGSGSRMVLSAPRVSGAGTSSATRSWAAARLAAASSLGKPVTAAPPAPAPHTSPQSNASPVVEAAGPNPAEAGKPALPSETTEVIPDVPFAGDIPAGHLWPTLKCRSILAAINGVGELVRPASPSAWAPEGAREWRSPNGWILHTTPDWVFEQESQCRHYLLQLVRRSLAMERWLPDGRGFFMAPDRWLGAAGAAAGSENERPRWRIWMISPDVPSASEVLERSLRAGHGPDLMESCRLLNRLRAGIEENPDPQLQCWTSQFGDLRALAVQQGRPVSLGAPDLGEPAAEWLTEAPSRMREGLRRLAVHLDAEVTAKLQEAARRSGASSWMLEQVTATETSGSEDRG